MPLFSLAFFLGSVRSKKIERRTGRTEQRKRGGKTKGCVGKDELGEAQLRSPDVNDERDVKKVYKFRLC